MDSDSDIDLPFSSIFSKKAEKSALSSLWNSETKFSDSNKNAMKVRATRSQVVVTNNIRYIDPCDYVPNPNEKKLIDKRFQCPRISPKSKEPFFPDYSGFRIQEKTQESVKDRNVKHTISKSDSEVNHFANLIVIKPSISWENFINENKNHLQDSLPHLCKNSSGQASKHVQNTKPVILDELLEETTFETNKISCNDVQEKLKTEEPKSKPTTTVTTDSSPMDIFEFEDEDYAKADVPLSLCISSEESEAPFQLVKNNRKRGKGNHRGKNKSSDNCAQSYQDNNQPNLHRQATPVVKHSSRIKKPLYNISDALMMDDDFPPLNSQTANSNNKRKMRRVLGPSGNEKSATLSASNNSNTKTFDLTENLRQTETERGEYSQISSLVQCPMCFKQFSSSVIENHAINCLEEADKFPERVNRNSSRKK